MKESKSGKWAASDAHHQSTILCTLAASRIVEILNPIKCNSKEKKLLKENIESSRILYLKK
jgi:hypothetical protein